MIDLLVTADSLQDAVRKFSDEQVCIDAVASMRWPNGVECPACGHKEHWYLKTQKRWKCKDCHRQFSVKVGTIFENSPVPLMKWLLVMWMIVNCKPAISSHEIHRATGLTQKAAWFMINRITKAQRSGCLIVRG